MVEARTPNADMDGGEDDDEKVGMAILWLGTSSLKTLEGR